ncbi:hypothetical protein LINPERPRIM_LOCUS20079 [Linum perenne]
MIYPEHRQVQGRRHFSSGTSAVVNHLHQEKLLQYNLLAGVEVEGSSTKTPCWVPDPRTGIYFPIGQEVVMEGIPETAACLGHDIWVRSVDTV